MPWNRFHSPGRRISPQRVRSSFALQVASVLSEVAKQVTPLHPTVTFSRLAEAGTPRRPSLRRSSRMIAIALDKLFSAAAFVRPWPLAPGISGQYAMCQGPARSTTAVNSFRIRPPEPPILQPPASDVVLPNAQAEQPAQPACSSLLLDETAERDRVGS